MTDNLPSPKPGESERWYYEFGLNNVSILTVFATDDEIYSMVGGVKYPLSYLEGRWLCRIPSPAEIARGQRAARFADDAIALFGQFVEHFGLDGPVAQEEQCVFEDRFKRLICEYSGHEIGPDQCGKPEHDLCYRCGRLRTEIEKDQPWPTNDDCQASLSISGLPLLNAKLN